MFEAVGERFWPAFFQGVRDRLRPGGLAGLQLITIADRYFDDYRRNADFIQTYIFPGGMLPSPTVPRPAGRAARAHARERAQLRRLLRPHAGVVERAVPGCLAPNARARLRRAVPRIWTYYLAYCEAGFRTGSIDVVQTVLRPA